MTQDFDIWGKSDFDHPLDELRLDFDGTRDRVSRCGKVRKPISPYIGIDLKFNLSPIDLDRTALKDNPKSLEQFVLAVLPILDDHCLKKLFSIAVVHRLTE